MARHVADYADEWRGVLEDPVKLARFTSFVNAPGTPDPMISFRPERGQRVPVLAADSRGGQPMTTMVDLIPVCRLADLQPERGVAALLPDGAQAALFRTHDGAVHALSNVDPFSGAAVLSRGIVGDRDGVPVVASPIYKQAFDLRTGRCLDDEHVSVPVFEVGVVDGMVLVGSP